MKYAVTYGKRIVVHAEDDDQAAEKAWKRFQKFLHPKNTKNVQFQEVEVELLEL